MTAERSKDREGEEEVEDEVEAVEGKVVEEVTIEKVVGDMANGEEEEEE